MLVSGASKPGEGDLTIMFFSPSPGSQLTLLADLSPPGRGEVESCANKKRAARTRIYFFRPCDSGEG